MSDGLLREPVTANSPAKRLVLIVEDDATIAHYYQAAISPFFDVEIVASLADGLARVARQPQPAAMILDLKLQNGEGIAVIKKFQDATPDIPMLVVTGQSYTREQIIDGAGAQEFIPKPYAAPHLLISTLSAIMGAHQAKKDIAPLQEQLSEVKKGADKTWAKLDSQVRACEASGSGCVTQ